MLYYNIANMLHYLIWSSFELPVAFIKRLFLLEKTMAYSNTLREEELKNKVANDYFSSYDNTKIIGNIDFCIAKITDKSGDKQAEFFNETQITQSLFWAEAKRGFLND